MAEPDPFGREKDEDPLAAMGWSDAPATPAETQRTGEASESAATAASGDAFGSSPAAPAAAASAVDRPPATMTIPSSQPRRGFALGCLPALLIVGAVFAIAAAIIIPIAGTVTDAVDEIDEAVDNPLPTPVDPGRAPRGLSEGSLLLRGNLAPALRSLRGELGGRLHYVRIEAQRVDVQVARGGSLRSGQARWDRDPQAFPAVRNSAAGSTFAWSRLDASAPRRFVRTATRRAGVASSAFDYAVLMDAAGLRWQVFLRDGTHFVASPDGRRVTKA